MTGPGASAAAEVRRIPTHVPRPAKSSASTIKKCLGRYSKANAVKLNVTLAVGVRRGVRTGVRPVHVNCDPGEKADVEKVLLV